MNKKFGLAVVGALTINCAATTTTTLNANATVPQNANLNDRHGVYYESCFVSTGSPEGAFPESAFIYWQGGNYVLIIKSRWGLEITDIGSEAQYHGYEYSVNTTCQGASCSGTNNKIEAGKSTFNSMNINWVSQKINDQMDVMVFRAPGLPISASCASFPVKGDTCSAVVRNLQDFVKRKDLKLTEIDITDKWCK